MDFKLIAPLVAGSIMASTYQSTAQELVNSTQGHVYGITQSYTCSTDSIHTVVERYTQAHTVKSGETIGGIAPMYGMSKDELMEFRVAIEGGDSKQSRDWSKIYAGDTLRVPREGSKFAANKIRTHLAGVHKKEHDTRLNRLYHAGDIKTLHRELDEVTPALFPKQVVNLGMKSLARGFLGNMRDDFDPEHPLMVDKGSQENINCGDTMTQFIGYGHDRTPDVHSLLITKGLDAWILPNKLLGKIEDGKLGYTRKPINNFMPYFNKGKIGRNDIIDDSKKSEYQGALLDLAKRLEQEGIPGSMLAIYFNLSNYKDVVKHINAKKPIKERHYNTHQVMYLGIGSKVFQADEVMDFSRNSRGEAFQKPTDIVNYVINFVQQRGSYHGARTKNKRNTIEKSLGNFHEVVHIKVNGKDIDLGVELQKPKSERFYIHPSDTIELSGGVVMDGFHDTTSSNEYKRKNNHVRTRFLYELLTLGDYTPSELIEPSQEMQHYTPTIGGSNEQIQVRNLYYLQQGDTIETSLKEAILKYIMEKGDLLDYTAEEIDMFAKIEKQKSISKTGFKLIKLHQQKAKLKKDRVGAVIAGLSEGEKSKLLREYARQINGLKLLGYMQHESKINLGTSNVNAPFPLIDREKTNIDALYLRYVNKRKKELHGEFLDSCGSKRDFLEIRFLEGDNSTNIFERIYTELEKQQDKYPVFSVLRYLNPLQKQEFLSEIVDKKSKQKVHVTKGIIPSSGNIILGLPEIEKITQKISEESYLQSIGTLSKVDAAVIEAIAKTLQERILLAYILTQESYTSGLFAERKILKELARSTGLRSILSYGDMQLRLTNLNAEDNALILWPNEGHLRKAISYLQEKSVKKVLQRRKRSILHKDTIETDLESVNRIVKFLDNLSAENRIETAGKIQDELQKLLRFDDGSSSNIVGKTIGLSLLRDKITGHYQNLNTWIERTGESIDDVIASPDLKERYTKSILVLGHRGETTALRSTAHSYMLRILTALGIDTKSADFPKIEKTWNHQISYGIATLKEHTDAYKNALKGKKDDTPIRDTLVAEIEKLENSNFSATSIYKFLGNKEIQNFLQTSGYDSHFLPTNEEFIDPGVRRILFDYASPPSNRRAPDVHSPIPKMIKLTGHLAKLDTSVQVGLALFAVKIIGPIVTPFLKILGSIILSPLFPGTLHMLRNNPISRRKRKYQGLKVGTSLLVSPIKKLYKFGQYKLLQRRLKNELMRKEQQEWTTKGKILPHNLDKSFREAMRSRIKHREVEKILKQRNIEGGKTSHKEIGKIWQEIEEKYIQQMIAEKAGFFQKILSLSSRNNKQTDILDNTYEGPPVGRAGSPTNPLKKEEQTPEPDSDLDLDLDSDLDLEKRIEAALEEINKTAASVTSRKEEAA